MAFDRLRRNRHLRRLLRPGWRALRRYVGLEDPFIGRESSGTRPEAPYFSQYGQDRWLHSEVFGSVRGGTFVEIGAHDGRTFSNTLFFESELEWSGLCVEPLPEVFERLRANRRADCIHAAVSAQPGVATFLRVRGYAEMLSGLEASQDPKHLERIRREVSEHGGSVEQVKVETYRLDSLIEEKSIGPIDLLCIDVEGAELDVLASFDLRAVAPRAVCIENNYRESKVWRRMRQAGYRPGVRMGADEIYLHRASGGAHTETEAAI